MHLGQGHQGQVTWDGKFIQNLSSSPDTPDFKHSLPDFKTGSKCTSHAQSTGDTCAILLGLIQWQENAHDDCCLSQSSWACWFLRSAYMCFHPIAYLVRECSLRLCKAVRQWLTNSRASSHCGTVDCLWGPVHL